MQYGDLADISPDVPFLWGDLNTIGIHDAPGGETCIFSLDRRAIGEFADFDGDVFVFDHDEVVDGTEFVIGFLCRLERLESVAGGWLARPVSDVLYRGRRPARC